MPDRPGGPAAGGSRPSPQGPSADGPLRIAYLGPAFSFSHLAATRAFGPKARYDPCPTIAAVFEAVRLGEADRGVVPLANSTDGRIVDTFDRLIQAPAPITAEIPLPIHHHLLARADTRTIHTVCSKPQALSQCRAWLARHLPDAVQQPAPSTTSAAQRARQEPGVAAIASREAGEHYGLAVVAECIEDAPDNITRFAVLGGFPPPVDPHAKTAVLFEVPHEVGALARALTVLADHGINLTWVESFPKRQSADEFLFFAELAGHAADPRIAAALEAFEEAVRAAQVLGTYLPIDLPG